MVLALASSPHHSTSPSPPCSPHRPSASPSPPPPVHSHRFNDHTAEITYQSSDGVLFHIHTVYLHAHTGSLAPSTGMSLDEVVPLTEPSRVLETLFTFIYPFPKSDPFADVEVNKKHVFKVAEAAEKYQVFPAMYACVIKMGDLIQQSPVRVLAHALKHGYHKLADQAAPAALDIPPKKMIQHIPAPFHELWFTYHAQWTSIQEKVLTQHLPRFTPTWGIVCILASSLRVLQNPESILGTGDVYRNWRGMIMELVEEVRPLTEELEVKKETRRDENGEEEEGEEEEEEELDPGPVIEGEETIALVCENDKKYTFSKKVLLSCAPGFQSLVPEPPLPPPTELRIHEPTDKMNLLLKFICPVPSPVLEGLSFEHLFDLAYAAEKYQVYQAMWMCEKLLRDKLPEHSLDIFRYAGKFKYFHTLTLAAPLVIDHPLSETLRMLPGDLHVAWGKYYSKWESVSQKCIRTVLATYNTHPRCACCKRGGRAAGSSFLTCHGTPVINELTKGPKALKDIDLLLKETMTWEGCRLDEEARERWMGVIRAAVG